MYAMANRLRLIVCGANGRMGRRVLELAAGDARFELVAGVDLVRDGAGAVPLLSPEDLPLHVPRADALVDFSEPSGSLGFAQAAARGRKPIVIGTTGFSAAQAARLKALARRTPVFLSPNFSLGMNLLFHLARIAAAALPGYDAGVSETHHALKKDAPSGSALRLAEAVRRARPRAPVPVVSLRLGTVVGDHALSLAGPNERLELTHRAESRDAFVRGALQAALWVRGRRPGLYDMQEMLGLP